MTMTLDYTINCTIWQSVDKHSCFIFHTARILLGIFGPSPIFVRNIAVIAEMSHNKNSICACFLEFGALADHDILVLQKFIIREQFIFEGIGS